MRTSAAVLAGAAGLTALAAGVMPAAANAATASPQAIAAQIVPANQLASFSQIISHESGWNVTATNPSSGSYGLGQALPASKMASAGAD
ncbi:lytic transglycosylase domain-containing protein, partial [Kitasatospora sp. NPDC059747]